MEIATLLKDNSKILHGLLIGPTVSSEVSSEVSSDVFSNVLSVDSNDSDSELCIKKKTETFSVNRKMILICVLGWRFSEDISEPK